MANYSENERMELMEVPVTDILKVFGRSTEHSHDNMYYSPFRDEKSPSFHISRDGRKWYDFGTGRGGTVLTLVCQLLSCDGGKAYDFLASVSRTFIQKDECEARLGSTGSESKRSRICVFRATRSFNDSSLVKYAEERRVSRKTLEIYCREVSFGYENHPGYRNTAIGFANNLGGWVLRAPDVKKCTSSDISSINIYGEYSPTPTSPAGIIFEGFFDFLSFIEISGEEWPKNDICILNSVTNIRKAHAWISQHCEICTMFDNDDAGRKALQELREAHPSVKVNDWSHLYSGHSDLNEALTESERERESLTTQYQSLWSKTFQKTFRKD